MLTFGAAAPSPRTSRCPAGLPWRRSYSAPTAAPPASTASHEAYHFGARYVSCLLGQALHAARDDTALLDAVLGPSVDLLVWILKQPRAEDPAGMRPLQLPTCFRRLYGAAVAGAIGPLTEPQLCADQAAVAGGHCGPNIRSAFTHLARHRAAPEAPSQL